MYSYKSIKRTNTLTHKEFTRLLVPLTSSININIFLIKRPLHFFFFFFFNNPAPTEIYPFPQHAPLPIPREPPPQSIAERDSLTTRRVGTTIGIGASSTQVQHG